MFDIAAIQDIDGEPRMRDLDIAEALGFEKHYNIRKLIYRHLIALSAFGEVFSMVEKTSSRGGRPGEEYWLNEKQALFICTKSEVQNAIDITIQMIEVFTAYRHGQLPPPREEAKSKQDAQIESILEGDSFHDRLALIRETRLVYDRKAAQKMWVHLGFPDIARIGNVGLPPLAAADDITLFLQENCTCTPNSGFTRTAALLNAYQGWCLATGRPPLTEFTFMMRLSKLAGKYTDPATGHGFIKRKSSVSGYMGIHIPIAQNA